MLGYIIGGAQRQGGLTFGVVRGAVWLTLRWLSVNRAAGWKLEKWDSELARWSALWLVNRSVPEASRWEGRHRCSRWGGGTCSDYQRSSCEMAQLAAHINSAQVCARGKHSVRGGPRDRRVAMASWDG
jgi:hypothetical protein